MSGRWRGVWLGIFPSLFAVYPTLFTAAQNSAEVSPGELAFVLPALWVCGAAMHLGVGAVLGRRASPSGRAVVAACLIAWFFCSNPVFDAISWTPLRLALRVLTPVAIAVLGWWQLRSGHEWGGASRFLGIFALALIASSAAQLVLDSRRVATQLERSAVARSLAVPVAPREELRPSRPPDIYLIILDQYGNSRALADELGFSNRAFEDSLRRLGFVVPADTRSNYSWTTQSLASLLNMEHLPTLTREVDSSEPSGAFMYHLIQHNRVFRALKERGYRILFQPNLRGWPGTRRSPLADSVYLPAGMNDPRAVVARSALVPVLLHSTVLGRWIYKQNFRSQLAGNLELAAFESVEKAVQAPGPKLVFLHSLVTHVPFRFDARCGPGTRSSPKQDYLEQVQCTNAQVLSMVSGILRSSATPPVILIQGDHGPRVLGYTPGADGMTSRRAADLFGAFGAYHLPGGGAASLPHPVTPVNLFRVVLNRYLGTNLPLRPDDAYHSAPNTWYRYTRVPDALFGSAPPASR